MPKDYNVVLREAEPAEVPVAREAEWVTAADFKAQCLRLIEQVRQGGPEVVVTRYGKPVARLVPHAEPPRSILGWVSGAVLSYGDLVSPVDEAWEADE